MSKCNSSDGKTPYDLMRATFPAGTVSVATKIRAMQIIADLEGTKREGEECWITATAKLHARPHRLHYLFLARESHRAAI